MAGPNVSVIIPTFNRKTMVQEAVRSVLHQTYRDFECLVVDDGSEDDTVPCLEQTFGGRIRVLRQDNRGVSAARNFGIRESNGPLIAFLDSDDTWLPQKLERQTAYLEAHPDCLICQTTEQWIRKGKRVNPREIHLKKTGALFAESLLRCMITPSSVMMRRVLFDDVGLFDESMPVCEDYDLWLRVTVRYPVGLITEDLLVRNGGRPDQLSSGHSLDKYRIQALEKILTSGLLNEGQRSSVLAVFKEKCRVFGSGCLKRGREEEGRHYLTLGEKVSCVN